MDVAAAEGEVEVPAYVSGDRPAPDPADIRRVAEVIARMERPAILTGGNTADADAVSELRAFSETLNAPVIFSRLGKGVFPDSHPLSAGHCRARLARNVLQQAHGLIAVGCRFTQIDTSGWTMELPSARVQLDPDPAELGREISIDAGAAGDLKQSVPALLDVLNETGKTIRRLERMAGIIAGRTRQDPPAAADHVRDERESRRRRHRFRGRDLDRVPVLR